MNAPPTYGWKDFQNPPWFYSRDYYAKFGLDEQGDRVHFISGLATVSVIVLYTVLMIFFFPNAPFLVHLIPAGIIQLLVRPGVIYHLYKKQIPQ